MMTTMPPPEKPPSVPKGAVLKTWEPHVIIPLWKGAGRDDVPYTDTLPGYLPCPVLSQLKESALQQKKDVALESFVSKLLREESMESIAMLATFETILSSQEDAEDWKNILEESSSSASSADDEEVDMSLLVEGWPHIQEIVSWNTCSKMYRRIYSRLHMVTLPHPLTEFAKESLLQMPEKDFEQAVRGASERRWIPKYTRNRLQASQLLLDYVASLPSRKVGVLLENPCLKATTAPVLPQSCVPSAALELTASSTGLRFSMLSLYDSTMREEEFTVSTRPPSGQCGCLRCQYGRDPQAHHSSLQPDRVENLQRLAHSLFLQDEKYNEAKKLYQLCHDTLPSDRVREKAEMWHAMGAVELTRHEFVKAQRHWRDGKEYATAHSEISLQLEKQQAYSYWNPLPSGDGGDDDSPKNQPRRTDYETISPRRLFVTSNMITPDTCQQLIEWAEEFGSNGGWTTSRHYAVPTNDIPVHRVPKILDWFQQWMNTHVQALLRDQFQTHRRFYVHDAFLVRYSAAAKSRFLPLHYDESTHSMVLALNDDFEGGGTYFYNVDQTIAPGTTGSLVTFRGNQLLHGGNVVTQGVRYILAVFMYLDDDTCSDEKGSSGHASKRQKILGEESAGGFSFGFF
jgi:hypothetical protein